jgi:hypothetical protein
MKLEFAAVGRNVPDRQNVRIAYDYLVFAPNLKSSRQDRRALRISRREQRQTASR